MQHSFKLSTKELKVNHNIDYNIRTTKEPPKVISTNDEPINRYFKVIDSPKNELSTGKYSGLPPKKSANKAFNVLIGQINNKPKKQNKTCAIRFFKAYEH